MTVWPAANLAGSPVFHTLHTVKGPIEFLFLQPEGPGPHPAILALPPRSQTRADVLEGLAGWRQQMLSGGYAVVSPVAPTDGLFTCACAHGRIPELLEHLAGTRGLRGDWHLFGISNGGRSALVVGPAYPALFASVTVLPGAVCDPSSLEPLGTTPITLAVGDSDGGWLESSQRIHSALKGRMNVELVVLPNQGHDAYASVEWGQLEGWLTRT